MDIQPTTPNRVDSPLTPFAVAGTNGAGTPEETMLLSSRARCTYCLPGCAYLPRPPTEVSSAVTQSG